MTTFCVGEKQVAEVGIDLDEPADGQDLPEVLAPPLNQEIHFQQLLQDLEAPADGP